MPFLLIFTCGLAFCGCDAPWWGLGQRQPRQQPRDRGIPTGSGNAPSSVFRTGEGEFGEDQVVDLVFDVVRAEMRMDAIRHSRKVWNHVDELRVAPELVARLARNGLRVGAASADAWPAIRAILDAAEAHVSREQLVAQRGLPLVLSLGVVGEDGESVFGYDAGGRLVGKTFSVGDKLLQIDYAYRPEFGGTTDLRLAYEIRHDRGVMTWERVDGVIRQIPAYDRHVFSDVRVALTLRATEFLVVGLSDQADNEYLVGGRFLTSTHAAKRYETVLCITPTPYRSSRAVRSDS